MVMSWPRSGIGALSAFSKRMRHLQAALVTTSGRERAQAKIRPSAAQRQ
jgi:hypothetical protein